MALSQIQCLEDNHVNWRTNESKPEFFYSEEQRLALEALFRDGRGAFHDYVKEHKVRQFLSELELERLSRGVHAYQPGGERAEGAKGSKGAEGEDGAESLQYWPERSDTSVPDLEIGWPDCTSYRGVTRVNVYTQPPLDGSTHIKEVVRKTIAQAQKVIAVAMDLFTDVDIFKDLLDASFKRKVAVYMNLRVRTIAGSEFYTRSSTKVCGLMSQKFMFVDGDRAVSGSYSFTWTASRLDRNLITVLTGQAVDTFDKLFRDLYATSTGVNLSKLSLQDEPEPEPLPQLAPAPLPSAAVARKLINPKYALVASSAVETGSGASSGKNSAKNSTSNNPMVKAVQKPKEQVEPPPIHPGLLNLERANLIHYLPTWPEPDPPSNVIGFINIRDTNKPKQVHLMRSELFETSQAIRFKDPFVTPEEPLPEKACPREKAGNRPTNVLVDQPQEPPQPRIQSAPESRENTKPNTEEPALDQTQTSENTARLEETVPAPVPKRRTIQLVITDDGTKEIPNVSMVKMTDSEPKALPLPHGPDKTESSKNIPGPPEPSSTSVTEPVRTPSEGGGGTDKEGEKDEQKGVRIIEDNDGTDGKGLSSSDLPRKASFASTVSDECFESVYSDNMESSIQLMVNGVHTGSGRVEDHRHVDGLNVMARFSQSMLDLRPESQQQLEEKEAENPQALGDIHAALEHNQRQLHKAGERKPFMTSSRPPGNITSMDRQGQPRGNTKVVIAKPGSYHRPAKAAGPVIGGHKYWQGKLFNQDKAIGGYITSNKLVPGLLGNSRTGRTPYRYRQDLDGQMGKSRTGNTLGQSSSLHRIPPTLGENCTPCGISISKLSQFKHLKGKVSGNALGSLQKKTQLGHKGAI
ncbi:protein FAM83G-like [Scleropages formosus]|uniref:Protein FAM83G-like n=1 Tax=Scleropages formosus TaxID=113540 RepID=A0A0N8K2Z2_SCLFO|nr:protein FAM83G-like [Scleropages formosus]